jgi:hypothetical protein
MVAVYAAAAVAESGPHGRSTRGRCGCRCTARRTFYRPVHVVRRGGHVHAPGQCGSRACAPTGVAHDHVHEHDRYARGERVAVASRVCDGVSRRVQHPKLPTAAYGGTCSKWCGPIRCSSRSARQYHDARENDSQSGFQMSHSSDRCGSRHAGQGRDTCPSAAPPAGRASPDTAETAILSRQRTSRSVTGGAGERDSAPGRSRSPRPPSTTSR